MNTTAMRAETAISRPQTRTRSWRPVVGQAVEAVLALLCAGFIIVPIVWLALTSFKPQLQVYSLDVFFQPTLDNYVAIFSPPYNMGRLLRNSVVVALASVAISIPLGVMAAYVFSRFRFRGSQSLMLGILVVQFLPPVVTAIPFFTLFRSLGLVDTLQALVIVYLSTTLPYSIWMLKGFIDALPVEIEEAAVVDGCTEAQTLRHITLPLVIPGVITVLVLAFIASWNEFTFATILTRRDAQTLPLGLLNTYGVRGFYWEQMAATGMLIMVPVFVMSFAVRKYFIEGLTMGAVK